MTYKIYYLLDENDGTVWVLERKDNYLTTSLIFDSYSSLLENYNRYVQT